MSSRRPLLSLVLALCAGSLAVGCAAPQEEDASATDNAITGGKDKSDSPVVFFFTSTDAGARPACVGTKLSNTIVVTSKACANAESVVRRARSKDGADKNVKIKAVHVPTDADADIAIVELASSMKGPNARITPMGLHDGYTIAGAATLDTNERDAVLLEARIESQTNDAGKLVPKDGQQICATDLGGSVFAKTPKRSWKSLWIFETGNWELSGVLAGAIAPTTVADPGASDPGASDPGSDPGASDPGSDPGASDPGANDPKANDPGVAPEQPAAAAGCTDAAWRVTSLMNHEAFLKKYAPDAFPQPKQEEPPQGGRPAPLAALKSCAIETTKLDPVKTGARTSVIRAKASFENVALGAAVGQFGIAPKSDPSKMTWSPATIGATSGSTFEAKFEGGLDAPATEGDYLIAFRASPDKGVTWTECDLDGSENGYSPSNALGLQVASAAPPAADPAPPPDYSSPPSSSGDDGYYPSEDPSSSGDEEEDLAPKKKSSDSGGCSVAHGSGGASSSLPLVGLVLGLSAFMRRRRNK